MVSHNQGYFINTKLTQNIGRGRRLTGDTFARQRRNRALCRKPHYLIKIRHLHIAWLKWKIGFTDSTLGRILQTAGTQDGVVNE